MDSQRLILFFVFSFSVFMLLDAWQREQQAAPSAPAARAKVEKPTTEGKAVPPADTQTVPTPSKPFPQALPKAAEPGLPVPAAGEGETVRVSTDLLIAEVDRLGGTLKGVEFIKHKDSKDASKNYVLLGAGHRYEAQSGIAGDAGPNQGTLWQAQPEERSLEPGRDTVELRLSAQGKDGLEVQKVYTFRRDSYVIDVSLEIRNSGATPVLSYAYFQFTHDGKPEANGDSFGQSFAVQSYTGFAVYSNERKFEKVQPSDLDKGKANHIKQANDGWLAFVQHYFVSAWLPAEGVAREYVLEKRQDGSYAGRLLVPIAVAPGATSKVTVPLYAGPQEQEKLNKIAPGLDLTVDYGWLTVIAVPLFWVLAWLNQWVGNWGVAIILLTVIIKLLFYPLSAASYRSMGKMRVLAPKLQKLKERYGEDRQRLQQAMMELYKTEKINPLGGCMPIVVQIPVFIALYWVLLASVELRHAPFVLWIDDLSARDPWYILPILMAGTMFVQTWLNPAPPDPVQARVMKIMPIVFSVFFFFFPAGLVLYWLVNNVLSIAQQWRITHVLERGAAPRKS